MTMGGSSVGGADTGAEAEREEEDFERGSLERICRSGGRDDAAVGPVRRVGEVCGTRRSSAGDAGAELRPRSWPSKSDKKPLRLLSQAYCLSFAAAVTRLADAGSGVDAADSERAFLMSISPTLMLRRLLCPNLCVPSAARARTVFSGERERERVDFNFDGDGGPGTSDSSSSSLVEAGRSSVLGSASSVERRIGGRGFEEEGDVGAVKTSSMGEARGRGEGMGGTGGGGAEALASDFCQASY